MSDVEGVKLAMLGLEFGVESKAQEMTSVPCTQGFGLDGPMGRLYRHLNVFCVVCWVS